MKRKSSDYDATILAGGFRRVDDNSRVYGLPRRQGVTGVYSALSTPDFGRRERHRRSYLASRESREDSLLAAGSLVRTPRDSSPNDV